MKTLEEEGGVKALEEGREQRQGGEENDADQKDEDEAGREVAILEELGCHEGALGRHRVGEEHIEGQGRDGGFDNDLRRPEPVQLLAAAGCSCKKWRPARS